MSYKVAMAERDPEKTYSYAAVEKALAAVHGIDERGRVGWLRARLQHFRRLGLAPEGPGRGKVISYTPDDIDRWLIALEVEFFKIDPTTAISFVTENWSDIARLLAEARASESDDADVLMTVHFDLPQKLPTVGGSTTVKGMHAIAGWLRGDLWEPARRVGIFNLSVRAKALDEALANPAPPRPPDPPGLAGDIIRAGRRARGAP
jgi:hypothetical protein